MSCEYGYYKTEETYYPRLYCKINDNTCIYSKRCKVEERFIPLDNQKECYIYNMEKMKNIPNGSCYIEFEKKGYLYIDIDDDKTIKIKNTLGKFDQNYVYVRDGIDGYEISLTEFPKKETKENKKKTYTRKTKEYEEKQTD